MLFYPLFDNIADSDHCPSHPAQILLLTLQPPWVSCGGILIFFLEEFSCSPRVARTKGYDKQSHGTPALCGWFPLPQPAASTDPRALGQALPAMARIFESSSCMLPTASFVIQQRNLVRTEPRRLAKPKIFTLWPLGGKHDFSLAVVSHRKKKRLKLSPGFSVF